MKKTLTIIAFDEIGVIRPASIYLEIQKKMIVLFLFILFLTSYSFGLEIPDKPISTCEVSSITYQGWKDSYLLTNGVIKLVVVPSIGRIMEYSLTGEKNIIYNNDSLSGKLFPFLDQKRPWHNYGGDKLWIAPEKKAMKEGWSYNFDNSPWKVEVISSSEINFIGPPVPLVGIKFSRNIKIYPDSSRVKIIETMENVSEHSVSWSIWNVSQVNPLGKVFFPLPKDKKVTYLFKKDPKDNQYQLKDDIFYVQYQGKCGKLGAASPGWIAYSKDNIVFTKKFTYFPNENYPDNNSSVEVFTSNNYVETEVLSPIKDLKPGQKYSFTQNWYLEYSSNHEQK
jgi:hypothetical protein